MHWYRNTGGPYRRDGFTVVPHNGEFKATDFEHDNFQRRAYMSHMVYLGPATEEQTAPPAPAPPEPQPETSEDGGQDSGAESGEESGEPSESGDATVPVEWTLSMSAERYLELYPEGPHADEAHAFLAQQEAEEAET